MIAVVFLMVLFGTQSLCTIRTQDSALNRQIFGSNGPYRDFVLTDCYEPLEKNPHCDKWEYAYHWNHDLRGCERAIYHGCNPTRNNFRTITACKSQAEPICTRRTTNQRRY